MKYLVKGVFLVLMVAFAAGVQAQSKIKVYDPQADAKADIAMAVKQAKEDGKHILLKIGGNWCPWCIKFHEYIYNEPAIKKIVEQDYIVVNVNYSKENKNADVLASLGYPQRFGFPVFVVLDENGKRLHTQDSSLLEADKHYSETKVTSFLKAWSPAALKAENYK